MKLEVKHLAPYAPYGVQVILGTTERDLIAISLDSPFVFVTAYVGSREKQMAGIENVKPILRPLSDLTKEITVNDEDFVPYEHFVFVEAMSANEYLEYLCEVRGDLSEDRLLPYSIVKLLFEWHFDVFGLINKGLAIDINSLSLADA